MIDSWYLHKPFVALAPNFKDGEPPGRREFHTASAILGKVIPLVSLPAINGYSVLKQSVFGLFPPLKDFGANLSKIFSLQEIIFLQKDCP
jgi:hypothetical protein